MRKLTTSRNGGNLIGNFLVVLKQAIQRLTDDLELAFDRSLCPSVANVGLAVHAFDEAVDVRAGPVCIRQQDAGGQDA